MEKIDELLLELKRVLSVIDDNYIVKIKSILDGDSEYDRLFYHYVDNLGIDKKIAKKLCNDRVKDVTSYINTNNRIRDYYYINDINDEDSKFNDLYKISLFLNKVLMEN